jgi:subtilisin family serine protease
VYSDGKFYDSSMPNADHGTRVADIIAGIHGNGIGVDGIAPDAAIVSIKVFDSNGDCTIADLNTAIYKAVNDYNCDIINLSLGSENNSTALRTAIQYALSNGVIVVAASGNDADKGNPIMYPASYDGVISVGAAGADYSWQSYRAIRVC